MSYKLRDHYYKKAQQEGYKARSVFKLDEIQNRFRLFNFQAPLLVLDLGCHPGSWSQWVLKHFQHPDSRLIGIDLKELELKHPKAHFLKMDARELTPEQLLPLWPPNGEPHFDLILSDMAPQTTGIKSVDQARSLDLCEWVIDFSAPWLKSGGHLCMKWFHSGEFERLREKMKGQFERFEAFRPQSTRQESKEIFLIGMRKK
jgi:23S rRNA (uridine2552-2'-O)-methyltransferase